MRRTIPMAVLLCAFALAACSAATEGDDVQSDDAAATSKTAEADRTTTTRRPTTTTTERPTTTTTTPPPPPLDGNGPSVVDVAKGLDPMVAYITANGSSRHCGIKNYDAAGNDLDLLVNTTDPYEGVVPIDFRTGEATTRFQVECEGPWRIELRSIMTLARVPAGQARAWRGDDVFVVNDADTLTITGNAGSRHMGINAYDISDDGDGQIDLLVNTTDPYNGEVISPSDAILVVSAEGDWSVTVNPAD